MIKKELTTEEKAARYDAILRMFKREYSTTNRPDPEFMAVALLKAELEMDINISYGTQGAGVRLMAYLAPLGKEHLAYEVDKE